MDYGSLRDSLNVDLQETFSDLQTDLELKVNFTNERYERFWTQQKLWQKYPIIERNFDCCV